MAERLQKILARAGIAARRPAEELIRAGRVRVDGRVVTGLGTKADLGRERIDVDGRRIVAERLRYFVMHKPRGVVSTMNDPMGRRSVTSLLSQVPERLVPVGRLDYASSGVLLLTNDGEFAAGLSHPRNGAEKIYRAKVQGIVDEAGLERWQESILIDGKATRPARVRLLATEGTKSWLEIRIQEGRNRQVRRLGEAAGFDVLRLVRTDYAGITLEGLSGGEARELTLSELRELKRKYGVPKRIHAGPGGLEEGKATRGNREREPRRHPTRGGEVRGEGKARPTRGGGNVRGEAKARPARGGGEVRGEAKARPTRGGGNVRGEAKARGPTRDAGGNVVANRPRAGKEQVTPSGNRRRR